MKIFQNSLHNWLNWAKIQPKPEPFGAAQPLGGVLHGTHIHLHVNEDKELSILTFTCIFYFIYMQVYVCSMQNTAEGLRRPERLWFR